MTLSEIKKGIVPPKPYRYCVISYFSIGIILYLLVTYCPVPDIVHNIIDDLKPFLGSLYAIERFAQDHKENPFPSQLMTVYCYFFSLFLYFYCTLKTFINEEYKRRLLCDLKDLRKRDVYSLAFLSIVGSIGTQAHWLSNTYGGVLSSKYLYSSNFLGILLSRLIGFYCFPLIFSISLFYLYAVFFLDFYNQSEKNNDESRK